MDHYKDQNRISEHTRKVGEIVQLASQGRFEEANAINETIGFPRYNRVPYVLAYRALEPYRLKQMDMHISAARAREPKDSRISQHGCLVVFFALGLIGLVMTISDWQQSREEKRRFDAAAEASRERGIKWRMEREETRRSELWSDREVLAVEKTGGQLEEETVTTRETRIKPFVGRSKNRTVYGVTPTTEEVERTTTNYRPPEYRTTYKDQNGVIRTETLDYDPTTR